MRPRHTRLLSTCLSSCAPARGLSAASAAAAGASADAIFLEMIMRDSFERIFSLSLSLSLSTHGRDEEI